MIPQIKEQRRLTSGMVMDGWPAYATLDSATVSFEEMGDRTITAEVSIDGDITPSFEGWELVFRNEVFLLQNLAPQAIKDNSSRCSTVSLVFRSDVIADLKRYFFFAKTSTETGTAIADKYKVPLGLSVTDFVRAYNDVLTSYFKGKIRMDLYPGTYSTETKYMDINYSYLWNVLDDFYKTYGLHWRIDYNETTQQFIIKVGYPRDSVANGHTFEYGYDGGLLKFERQVQDDTIYNVLFGRGGEKNLPYRYFKFLDPNNTAFLPDPDAIPELKNIYFDRLRDSNFRSYIQGWKTNPNRILGERYFVCDRCETQYHTDVPPDHCLVCGHEQFSEGHEYGEVEAYDAQRGETDWAYKKGHEDELFDPVEYEKDDDSIALYGVRHGTLDDNDDIFPTIQGTGLDEVVDVSQITSDDEGEEGAPSFKLKMVAAQHTEDYSTSTFSHVIHVPSVTFDSEVFTIPNGYKGFKINDPIIEYAKITYLWKPTISGNTTIKEESILSDCNVTAQVIDEDEHVVSLQELLPGNDYRVRFTITDNEPISLGNAYGSLASVIASAYINLDTYNIDGFVVPNGLLEQINVPAYTEVTKIVYSETFTTEQDHALVIEAPIIVRPATGAAYSSTFEIVDASTGDVVQSSDIPIGTYKAKVYITANNTGSSATTAMVGLRPMMVYYSDPNQPWVPTFDIWVKNLWSTTQGVAETDEAYSRRVWTPILGNRAGDTAKVVFSSGFLASSEDYEFTIVSYPTPARGADAREGAEWKITLQKSDVEYDAIGMYIPNSKSGWQAFPGDTFYFIGIDVPHMYVLLAEERLHQTKVDALREKAWSNPTYAVTLDKIRIHTSEDSDNGIRLVDDLDAGRIMRISDSRFSDGPLSIPIRTVSFVWNKTEATSQYLVPDVEIVLSEKVERVESNIAALNRSVAFIGDTYVSGTELKKSMSRTQQKTSSAIQPLTYEAGSMQNFTPDSYDGKTPKSLVIPSTFAHLTDHPTTLQGYGISDAVTLNTAQNNISGAKTFTALLTLTNGVSVGNITHTQNLPLYIGNSANYNYIRIREDMRSDVEETIYPDTEDEEDVPYWEVSIYGASKFKSLTINNGTAYITSGGALSLSGNANIGGECHALHLFPNQDMTGFIGMAVPNHGSVVVSKRWAQVNALTVGANMYYFSDQSNPGANFGHMNAGDGWMTISNSGWTSNYVLYGASYAGFFYNGGGVPLGQAANRWSTIYGVDGNFSGNVVVGRLYLDANTYIEKDANTSNWHLKTSVSGGSVNLIVDGDISCAG